MTTFSLKLLALILMTIDHAAIFFAKTRSSYFIMRTIGRLSFPIFAFCLTNGFRLTSNKKKMVLRIFLFALLSQPFYLFAFKGYFNNFSLNIFWTFFFSLFIIWINENNKISNFIKIISDLFIIWLLIIFELSGVLDYGIYGILTVFIFYFLKDKKGMMAVLILILNVLKFELTGNYIQIFSVFSLIFIYFYNGKKGPSLKYLFYLYYPCHLLLLYLLKIMK